ncbi:hypothetical protein HY838_00755 [Candidatus Azambacteria bacterium]|nr:hypothetical protein [Candidatus Azambacteria bacterium]
MIIKNRFAIAFAISAGVAFGVFAFAPASKTVYVNNNGANYLASADENQTNNLTDNKIGDLSNNIIPTIRGTQNITDNFAAKLTEELISKNSNPKIDSSNPGLNAPDVNAMAENFISDGLKKANENILNINPPSLKISNDNSKPAIKKYILEMQAVLNKNLKPLGSLFDTLNSIVANNDTGMEKLSPIITAYETAADQLEQIPVPSSLKNLTIDEIRLLRITANVLRAFANIENDPMGAMAATEQFKVVLQSWLDLQNKFNAFVKKFNQS